MHDRLTITIDGLFGAGKTTISEELARLLDYRLIASGNMFRAVAVLAAGELNERKITSIAQEAAFDFVFSDGFKTIVNGMDMTADIASPSVVPFTSEIAQIAPLREILVQKQRALAEGGGVIVEGRDASTVVFPNADWKIFLDADFDVRVRRMFAMLTVEQKAEFRSMEEYAAVLSEVDKRDQHRTKRSTDSIYHKTGLFSSREEAIVLYHYIAQTDEMVENVHAVSARHAALSAGYAS
jgi:CMP/dCMP kinase